MSQRITIPLAHTLREDHATRAESAISTQKAAEKLCCEAWEYKTKSKDAHQAVLRAIKAQNIYGGREISIQSRLNAGIVLVLELDGFDVIQSKEKAIIRW